jgi:hypothetical protein
MFAQMPLIWRARDKVSKSFLFNFNFGILRFIVVT